MYAEIDYANKPRDRGFPVDTSFTGTLDGIPLTYTSVENTLGDQLNRVVQINRDNISDQIAGLRFNSDFTVTFERPIYNLHLHFAATH